MNEETLKALKRIADALEKIADILEEQSTIVLPLKDLGDEWDATAQY